MPRFRMGSLDHMHLVVPNREEAAGWYEETLGFERVEAYARWAAVEGGPLHLSADGGRSGIALFEAAPHGSLPTGIGKGVAFKVDAPTFVAFARQLDSRDLRSLEGERLTAASVVDFDLCFSFTLVDPYGHPLELNCYDYEAVRRELVEGDGVVPVRYW